LIKEEINYLKRLKPLKGCRKINRSRW